MTCCRSRWDGPTATCTSSSPATPATACPIRSSTPSVRDEAGCRLADLPTRFGYLYDFGDGWTHDIEVLGPGRGTSRAAATARAAARRRTAAAPPATPNLSRCWPIRPMRTTNRCGRGSGEWPEFDQARTDRQVRAGVGQVPASVACVLGLIGGRGEADTRRPAAPGAGPAGAGAAAALVPAGPTRPVEEDLLPLAVLHDLMRSVGLLRLAKGVLTPTRAAATTSRWCAGCGGGSHRGSSAPCWLATSSPCSPPPGRCPPTSSPPGSTPWFEHGWSANGHPLTPPDLRTHIGRMSAELRGLDQISGDWRMWYPGPAARSLLPHATAMTHWCGCREPGHLMRPARTRG